MSATALLALVDPLAFGVCLLVLARISRRLGKYTHDKPHFRWLYLAAGLMGVSLVGRLALMWAGAGDGWAGLLTVLVYGGLPALAVTIGLAVIWRYWSWLLAERG
jgi:hypothetical protein